MIKNLNVTTKVTFRHRNFSQPKRRISEFVPEVVVAYPVENAFFLIVLAVTSHG
jgi:hypothetical protein